MTNVQLYITVALPVLAVLISLMIQLQAVKHLREEMISRINGLNQRMDGIDQRLDRMDQRFDRIDQRLDRMDQRLDGMNLRLDHIQESFIKDHTERLVRLEASVYGSRS